MLNDKRTTPTIFFILLFSLFIYSQPVQTPKTYCNPMNLNYRFMVDAVDAREAADPVMVLFKGDYYLFASRSGGYWTSPNLRDWTLIVPTGIDIETYAPAVVVMRDSLFYIPSANGQIYKTGDPKSGVWTNGPTAKGYGDPAFFLDDDGRLYMYYGLSNNAPTSVVELDPITFREIGTPVNIVYNQASIHGWERRGDDNLLDEQPWIEGTWMIKENNKYYLHYSAPGTEFKTYADGIYVADSAKGPFQYADYSPFSFKPTGFIAGAGHGCTFKDKDGNYWRVVTMTISVKHIFERRLGLFPVSFDNDGDIFCNTAYGDYPQFLPGEKENPGVDNGTGMMLLSHKKYVTASSELTGYGPEKAVDEEVRTYWAAQTGNPGEWLLLDLGKECNIQALQINFGEHGTDPQAVRGRNVVLFEQYTIETSNDGLTWTMLIDKSQNTKDVPHDYIELAQTVEARYVRLTNVFTPGGGKFAVRGLRVFGNSAEAVFTPVNDFTVERSTVDGRDAIIRWTGIENADGYIIRYGIAPDKLYNHYMVYDVDSVAIHSLNHGVEYYFEVEAFDSGTDYYRAEGEFRSGQTGDWNDINSWEQNNGTEWVAASTLPSPTGGPVTILDGHTITVTADDSADQVTVAAGGKLVISVGVNFLVQNGIGDDLRVNGELSNSGNVTTVTEATIRFGDGGKYSHEQEGGAIPKAIWGVGSTCEITNFISGSKPGNLNQDFYNFLWNCTGQTSNVDWGWFNNTVGGDITVQSTGSAHAYLTSPGAGNPNTITINGGINVEAGQFASNGSSSTAEITVDSYGNVNVTGGNFSVSRGSGPTVEWNLFGDFSMSNATTQNSNPAGAKFIFTGKGERNLTLGGGNTLTALPIEVDSGTALNMGTSELQGSGIFLLNAGATLLSGHPDGIDGNIKNTGTRTLNSQAGYGFNGTSAQVTGNLLPDEVENLIMDNNAGVTLSKSVTVNGILDIKQTGLSIGSYELIYGPGSALRYSGTTAMSTSDSEFPEEGGPENVIIANSSSSGITLHANRTITGNLHLSRKFRLADYNFTAASTDIESSYSYVYTNGTGSLTILNVGAAETLFPIGLATYAPVWITNNGTVDDISARVESDTKSLPDGGRVRAKWILGEGTAGGGDYTLKFGWLTQLEDSKFRQDKPANAGIFLLASDTTEAGTSSYTTQFDTLPYTVSRGGITTLGSFGVGKFGQISVDVKSPKNLPSEFRLSQSYPNPFNSTTRINYSVPKNSYITLKVYNLLGEEVTTLFEGFKQLGNYTAMFDASGLSSGMYFYRMTAENFTDTKKTILLK
jgi:xylan 1,4-beta-xylosidase